MGAVVGALFAVRLLWWKWKADRGGLIRGRKDRADGDVGVPRLERQGDRLPSGSDVLGMKQVARSIGVGLCKCLGGSPRGFLRTGHGGRWGAGRGGFLV